jgi:hypothetical protein
MSIKTVLTKCKFNETVKDVWHTKSLSHEVMILDDRMSVISLSDDNNLSKILYKGVINSEAENILKTI